MATRHSSRQTTPVRPSQLRSPNSDKLSPGHSNTTTPSRYCGLSTPSSEMDQQGSELLPELHRTPPSQSYNPDDFMATPSTGSPTKPDNKIINPQTIRENSPRMERQFSPHTKSMESTKGKKPLRIMVPAGPLRPASRHNTSPRQQKSTTKETKPRHGNASCKENKTPTRKKRSTGTKPTTTGRTTKRVARRKLQFPKPTTGTRGTNDNRSKGREQSNSGQSTDDE